MSKILICRCLNRKLLSVPSDIEKSLDCFDEVVFFDDLCSSVINAKDKLVNLTADEDFVVLACNQRAIEALFDYAYLNKPKKVFDIRFGDISDFNTYIASLDKNIADTKVVELEGSEDNWYPCIDQNECINCAKCVDFCIFGVYVKDNGKVKVQNPTNCKDNCPACARTCPKSAIIFPKCPDEKIAGKLDSKADNNNDKPDFYNLLKNRRNRKILK